MQDSLKSLSGKLGNVQSYRYEHLLIQKILSNKKNARLDLNCDNLGFGLKWKYLDEITTNRQTNSHCNIA